MGSDATRAWSACKRPALGGGRNGTECTPVPIRFPPGGHRRFSPGVRCRTRQERAGVVARPESREDLAEGGLPEREILGAAMQEEVAPGVPGLPARQADCVRLRINPGDGLHPRWTEAHHEAVATPNVRYRGVSYPRDEDLAAGPGRRLVRRGGGIRPIPVIASLALYLSKLRRTLFVDMARE